MKPDDFTKGNLVAFNLQFQQIIFWFCFEGKLLSVFHFSVNCTMLHSKVSIERSEKPEPPPV